MTWRFNAVDRAGPYSWAALDDPAKFKQIIEHLSRCETLSEQDLARGGSHSIELHKLSKEARDRLVELKLDDVDSLFSIRCSGKERVFCIHRQQYLRVLWYDPEHSVCPSPKKHT